MSFNLIQFLSDLLRWDHAVVYMPRFDAFGWEEFVVVVKGFYFAYLLVKDQSGHGGEDKPKSSGSAWNS